MSTSGAAALPSDGWGSPTAPPPPSPTDASAGRGSAPWLPAARAAVLSAVEGPSPADTRVAEPLRAPQVLARIASVAPFAAPASRFELLRQWEGTVVEVEVDSFTVTLQELTDRSAPAEDAQLWLEDVSPGDRPLVVPGAVFYWSIGYEDTPRGRERKSILRFRRLPGWSARALAAAKARAAQLSDALLGESATRSE